MKPYFLAAVLAAGLYAFPLWQENAATACQALNKRAGDVANAMVVNPGAFGDPFDTVSALERDSAGGMKAISLASVLPPLPHALGCVLGYWHLMLTPNVAPVVASLR